MSSPLFLPLKPWMLARYGRETHRLSLDAGSTCPNRDGTRGFGGCTYCDVEGSGTGALKDGIDLRRQMEVGLARLARRAGEGESVGVVAYFQSYSNTYVAPERLRLVLDSLEPWLPGGERDEAAARVVCVALATRPDTLPEWALDQLCELKQRTGVDVWLELGLETASDEVQRRIHRLHTLEEFHSAVQRAHARGLLCVGHAILGLPGDGREGARRTAEELARAGVAGVKVHHLMVLQRTVMAKQWKQGELETLDAPTYVEWLADFVERLHPEQVLHRLTGDAPAPSLLAPHWPVAKNEIRNLLQAELQRRGTRQGALWSASPS
jgi:radical SAM protein (TIGR01212 family)